MIRPRRSAGTRLLAALVSGGAIGAVVSVFHGGPMGVLAAIVAFQTLFVVAGWVALWPMDAINTRRNARREDFRPFVDELLVVGSAAGALIGIVVVLVLDDAMAQAVASAIALAGVFMGWSALHLMYAAHYAYIYYRDSGGIDFNSEADPSYRDFFYFGYSVGMAYSVPDTNVSSSAIRAVVLRHALLSYVFGVAILATTLDLVIGVIA